MNDGARYDATVEVGLSFCEEFYGTLFESEEGVVFPGTNVSSGHYFRASLAYDDFADRDRSPVGAFDAEVLRVGII